MKFSSYLGMASAAVLCLAAGTASAKDVDISWEQSTTTPYIWSATNFGHAIVTSSFMDVFKFTNPVTPVSLGGGAANVGSLGINGTDVIFSLFKLVDVSTGIVLADGITGGKISDISFLLPIGDKFELYVKGDVTPGGTSGGYYGNLQVSAVPEPQTYAMLLAGLGLLAFTARRRRNSFF